MGRSNSGRRSLGQPPLAPRTDNSNSLRSTRSSKSRRSERSSRNPLGSNISDPEGREAFENERGGYSGRDVDGGYEEIVIGNQQAPSSRDGPVAGSIASFLGGQGFQVGGTSFFGRDGTTNSNINHNSAQGHDDGGLMGNGVHQANIHHGQPPRHETSFLDALENPVASGLTFNPSVESNRGRYYSQEQERRTSYRTPSEERRDKHPSLFGRERTSSSVPPPAPHHEGSVRSEQRSMRSGASGNSGRRSAASQHTVGTNQTLTWRLDPNESLSDWTIKITRKGTGAKEIYHVHRMVLAVGPRRSEYFAMMFQKRIKENKSSTLRLEMADSAADAFPTLLDYMYGDESLRSVSKRSDAYALYSHAEYFEMPGLMKAVANWFRKKLRLSKLPEYLEHAYQFRTSDPLLEVAVDKCAEKFDAIGPRLAGQIGPEVLVLVFRRAWDDQFPFHHNIDYITDLVLECVQQNKLNRSAFDEITDKKYLPRLEPRPALKLLIVDAEYNDAGRQLTCLQSRCVKSLSKNWEQVCFEFQSAESMANCLGALPSRVLAEVMVCNANFRW